MPDLRKHNGTIAITFKGTTHKVLVSTETRRGRTRRIIRKVRDNGKGAKIGMVKDNGEIVATSGIRTNQALVDIVRNPSKYAARGFAFQMDRRCRKCGSHLSDPTSLAIGLGPVCRKK